MGDSACALAPVTRRARRAVRVRVESMGSQQCGIVGKSQPVLSVTDAIIYTRTRSADIGCYACCSSQSAGPGAAAAEVVAPQRLGTTAAAPRPSLLQAHRLLGTAGQVNGCLCRLRIPHARWLDAPVYGCGWR
jgi:hypothetical protein